MAGEMERGMSPGLERRGPNIPARLPWPPAVGSTANVTAAMNAHIIIFFVTLQGEFFVKFIDLNQNPIAGTRTTASSAVSAGRLATKGSRFYNPVSRRPDRCHGNGKWWCQVRQQTAGASTVRFGVADDDGKSQLNHDGPVRQPRPWDDARHLLNALALGGEVSGGGPGVGGESPTGELITDLLLIRWQWE